MRVLEGMGNKEGWVRTEVVRDMPDKVLEDTARAATHTLSGAGKEVRDNTVQVEEVGRTVADGNAHANSFPEPLVTPPHPCA
jgi:hypothetical protein